MRLQLVWWPKGWQDRSVPEAACGHVPEVTCMASALGLKPSCCAWSEALWGKDGIFWGGGVGGSASGSFCHDSPAGAAGAGILLALRVVKCCGTPLCATKQLPRPVPGGGWNLASRE